ncbi:MAG: SEC-C metal-binding domain-containing protein, partial [Candidatus Rickettsiella isopodorum]|nr:SEC-C metal-binding domain-containing protein [Candidatus Rickettsiella isopodorum]
RKQLLEFDNVANEQRKVIYEQRNELLATEDISPVINNLWTDVIYSAIEHSIPPQSLEEQWNISNLKNQLKQDFCLDLPIDTWLEDPNCLEENLREKILLAAQNAFAEKENLFGSPTLRQVEKTLMLQTLDTLWKDHLAAMDHLRQGIHLRGYAQKNPKQEYKRESFLLFAELLEQLKYQIISLLSCLQIRTPEDAERLEEQRRQQMPQLLDFQHQDLLAADETSLTNETASTLSTRNTNKTGRNDPCPCDSGKKYKHCHGKIN